MRIPLRLPAFAAMALLVAAGCTSTTGSTWTVAPLAPTPSAPPSAAPTAAPTAGPSGPAGSADASAATARTVKIELTSSLQFQQDGQQLTELEVQEGETIHFVLDNTAGFAHDFWIGPPDKLSASLTDGLEGVPEWDSGVKELDYVVTADTANLQFGCTVPGHFQSMHGTFKVTP
ncbi:MAG: hypothetical protein U0667_12810 [Chloroflexota bacterium]